MYKTETNLAIIDALEKKERTPLLKTTPWRKLRPRSCCIRSKAALLVLCWNILVTVSVGYILEYGLVLATAADYTPYANKLQTYAPVFFGFFALLYLFYPLAGCLADIRCGRYRTITNSLWFIIWGGAFTCIGATIVAYYYCKITSLQTIRVSVTVLLAIGFGLSTFFGIILLLSSYISFSANAIQFGIDQLHDSPSEDSVLFIQWFVFALHLGAAINKFMIISMMFIL